MWFYDGFVWVNLPRPLGRGLFQRVGIGFSQIVFKFKIVLAKASYYSIPIPRPKGHGNYLLNLITYSKCYRTENI